LSVYFYVFDPVYTDERKKELIIHFFILGSHGAIGALTGQLIEWQNNAIFVINAISRGLQKGRNLKFCMEELVCTRFVLIYFHFKQ